MRTEETKGMFPFDLFYYQMDVVKCLSNGILPFSPTKQQVRKG